MTPVAQHNTLVQQLHLHPPADVSGDMAVRNISPARLHQAEMNHLLVNELHQMRDRMQYQEAEMQHEALNVVELTRARAEQALQEQQAGFRQTAEYVENTARQVTETEIRDYQRDFQ